MLYTNPMPAIDSVAIAAMTTRLLKHYFISDITEELSKKIIESDTVLNHLLDNLPNATFPIHKAYLVPKDLGKQLEMLGEDIAHVVESIWIPKYQIELADNPIIHLIAIRKYALNNESNIRYSVSSK